MIFGMAVYNRSDMASVPTEPAHKNTNPKVAFGRDREFAIPVGWWIVLHVPVGWWIVLHVPTQLQQCYLNTNRQITIQQNVVLDMITKLTWY